MTFQRNIVICVGYDAAAKKPVCLALVTQDHPYLFATIFKHIIALEVERHRDTPNFCVCVISDIYQYSCIDILVMFLWSIYDCQCLKI